MTKGKLAQLNWMRAFVACAALGMGTLASALEFDRSFINLPASTTAFVTSYDLDGDGRKDALAVFQRRVLVFFQTKAGTFPTKPDIEIGSGAPIPRDYAAVAIGKVSSEQGQQLILVGEEGADYVTLSKLRGNSSQPVEPASLLVRHFDITPGSSLGYLDGMTDLNGDGKADIVLPNNDQLEIYTKGAQGKFEQTGKVYIPLTTQQQASLRPEPMLLGSPMFGELLFTPDFGVVETMPRFDRRYMANFAVQSWCEPFLLTDYNRDGRMDVITPTQILYQNQEGQFKGAPSNIYSRISSASAVQGGRSVVAPNLVDFNGDGILDTFRVEATAAKLSPRTDVSIFLGKPDRTLPEEPDMVLHTKDFAYSELIPVGDINGDGCQDIALFHLEFQSSSPNSQLKAYLKKGLDGELRFYLWDKKANKFPNGPEFVFPMMVNYEIYGARQLFQQQVCINTDMDGDGIPDLVIKSGAEEISIYKNLGGDKGYARTAMAEISTKPTKFSSFTVTDLNGDKKGDIVIAGYSDDQDDRVIYSAFVSK